MFCDPLDALGVELFESRSNLDRFLPGLLGAGRMNASTFGPVFSIDESEAFAARSADPRWRRRSTRRVSAIRYTRVPCIRGYDKSGRLLHDFASCLDLTCRCCGSFAQREQFLYGSRLPPVITRGVAPKIPPRLVRRQMNRIACAKTRQPTFHICYTVGAFQPRK
jgi:hypothetical protein